MSAYCPAHDPILACPPFTCQGCGTEAWPTAAEWLDGTLILATYEQDHCRDCGWPQQWSAVIGTEDGSDLPCPPSDNARKARDHFRDEFRCTAPNRAGRRCGNTARERGGRCWIHADGDGQAGP